MTEFEQLVLSKLDCVSTDVGLLKADVSELKADVVELKADVSELKADVVELKADVSELKADVVELKADVSELKADVVELKADVSELKADVVKLKADVSELKADVDRLEEGLHIVNLKIENDLRKMINIVGDGHDFLNRRLDEAIRDKETTEHLELGIINLRMDVNTLKTHQQIV